MGLDNAASTRCTLSGLDVRASSFAKQCSERLLSAARVRALQAPGQRWSLVESGLTARDWQMMLDWAGLCSADALLQLTSLETGIMVLLTTTAVARTLEEEGLWQAVADASSSALRWRWFGERHYLRAEGRDALRDACRRLNVRQQLDARGKHYYWRTVMLQFGFSARSAARQLPVWLASHQMPEVVRSLLEPGDENSSAEFRSMWAELDTWDGRDADILAKRMQRYNWYPHESHRLLAAGLLQGRARGHAAGERRIEDEPPDPTLFGLPRLVGDSFALDLTARLPGEFEAVTRPVPVFFGETSSVSIERGEDGRMRFTGGALQLPVSSVLERPVREIKAALPGGLFYRERFTFWDETQDVVLFCGARGRRTDVVPERDGAGAIIARRELSLWHSGRAMDAAYTGREWALYHFAEGVPSALEVLDGEDVVWSAGDQQAIPEAKAGEAWLELEEKSLTQTQLNVKTTPDWQCVHFRFAGRSFRGSEGLLTAAPGAVDRRAVAVARLRRGAESVRITLRTRSVGSVIPGAAYQDEQQAWQSMSGEEPLDSALCEGRPLRVRWDATADPDADVWLMLGDQPLFPEPHLIRRQAFHATGEKLHVRVRLVNEERDRRQELRPMYATGLLAAVIVEERTIRLRLREVMEAAAAYRVLVWERGQMEPRLLEATASPLDEDCFVVQDESVKHPLAWAICYGRAWRGARFHTEPSAADWPQLCTGWRDMILAAPDWRKTASLLRAWRFPVLMDPFRQFVEFRARNSPLETLEGWTESPPISAETALRVEPGLFTAPLRRMLWTVPITDEDVAAFGERNAEDAAARAPDTLHPPLGELLRAHPVLFVRVLAETLKQRYTLSKRKLRKVPVNLFEKRYAADDKKKLDQDFLRVVQLMLQTVQRHFGLAVADAAPDNLTHLLDRALSEMRSWNETLPMDRKFFERAIRDRAEALYRGDAQKSKELRIAVARSPACCAYLACHLLCVHLYLPLKKDEL